LRNWHVCACDQEQWKMRNLDPGVYVDPAVFARECERIFWATWQLIGPASRLASPGQYVATEIAGAKVMAVRGPTASCVPSEMSAVTGARVSSKKAKAAATCCAASITTGSTISTDR
jgi:hypothetical protein